jgi:hypothetical protein
VQAMDVDGGAAGCTVELLAPGVPSGSHFMSNKISERVAYLERRMLDFASALEEAEGCSVANPVSVPTQVLSTRQRTALSLESRTQGPEKGDTAYSPVPMMVTYPEHVLDILGCRGNPRSLHQYAHMGEGSFQTAVHVICNTSRINHRTCL